MTLNRLSAFWPVGTPGAVHSFGTWALGIFGNSGPSEVAVEEVRVGIGEAAGVGVLSFCGANKFELPVLTAGRLENGLEASLAGAVCEVVSFCGSVDEFACDLKPENADGALKTLSALVVSGWKVCEKSPLVLG
jgi:hypothetical protein